MITYLCTITFGIRLLFQLQKPIRTENQKVIVHQKVIIQFYILCGVYHFENWCFLKHSPLIFHNISVHWCTIHFGVSEPYRLRRLKIDCTPKLIVHQKVIVHQRKKAKILQDEHFKKHQFFKMVYAKKNVKL